MDRYSELIKKHYPITSNFFSKIEFSELSKLYFKQFPLEINLEKDNTFYFPVFLKSIKKDRNIRDFLYELADFEVTSRQITSLPADEEVALAQLQPGEVRLNPVLSIHRFENDILTFVQELKHKTNPNQIQNSLPTHNPNITFITRNLERSLVYLKATPQMACVIDYMSEGQMPLRLLSSQLLKFFPQFFTTPEQVSELTNKLTKCFVILQKP